MIGVGGRLVLRVSGVESHRCVSQANYCIMVLAPNAVPRFPGFESWAILLPG